MAAVLAAEQSEAMECDVLVIGGGSAGCVLASRLSENPARRIILAEAGGDIPPGCEPAAVADARFRTLNNPAFLWPGLTARFSKAWDMPLPFGQARLLGGGSAINGMHAQRGLPADYDEWRQLGVTGWGWADILPYFKKLEADRDFVGAAHGSDGPVPISRVERHGWSGLSNGIAAALAARGFEPVADLNGQDGDGFGPVPINIEGKQRVTSARAYLTARVRARPNLRILTERTASSLRFDGDAVVGAFLDGPSGRQIIKARETILASGALHTPALLLRSGVGDAAALRRLGKVVRVNLPGVGANLLNHPMLILGAHLRPAARQNTQAVAPCPMVVRYSSGVPDCPPTDMLLNVWERAPNALRWDPLGRQFANLMVIVNKVYSQGSVTLAEGDGIQVDFNMLDDPRDRSRMVASLSFLGELLGSSAVSPLVNAAMLPAMSPLALLLMQDNMKAQMLSMAGAAALSGPSALRDRLLRGAGTALDVLLADKGALDAVVQQAALPGGHVAGTCRMGDPGNKMTVTDSHCRVVGLRGLRVVDASIFPTLMAAGTNLPVMMAAEKVAAGIAGEASK